MQIQDYDIILNSLQLTGIYVIREDSHQILYFNQKIKDVTPNIEVGMVDHDLWKDFCTDCLLPLIENKNAKEARTTIYNNPFGKTAEVTAKRIVWQNDIPAFLVSIVPHTENADYTYSVILKANLTTNRYHVIKSSVMQRMDFTNNFPHLSDFFTGYVNNGHIHNNDIEPFLEFTQIEHLQNEMKKPKKIASFVYRYKAEQGYRWHTMEIIPDYDYSEDHQTVMVYCKDIHDICIKGLALEELNTRNHEIIESLGEMNFAIYVIDLNTGMMNPIRLADDIEKFHKWEIINWENVLKDNVDILYHPDYRDRVLQMCSLKALQQAQKDGKQKMELFCQRMIQSNYHYVSITAYFHRTSFGNDFAVISIRDIDKYARQEIRHSQNDVYIAALIRARYDTMSTVNLNTGMCERIYLKNDLKSDNTIQGDYNFFIKKAINEGLVCEEDIPVFEDNLLLDNLRRKAQEDDGSTEIIFEYRVKTPKIAWLQVQTLFIHQDNGIVIANLLSRDITKQKLKEAEEKEEKQDWNYIISSLSSMFFASYYIDLATDTVRIIKQTSKSGGHILSITQNYNEAISTYSQHSVHPDNRKEYIKIFGLTNLLKSLTSEQPYLEMEYKRIKKKDHEPIVNGWIRATIILIETKDNVPTKALYVEQDITENKRREEKEVSLLREACESANRANASKSEFLSRMSHDIRTPLNAVIGMTTIASSHLEDQDKISDCLDKIKVSSRHLLSLVNEVLDMSKIESGKLKLSEEKFSLSDLIQNVLKIIRPSLEEKQHTLDFHVANVEHDEVIGDISRLLQVFMSILENAVKYTPNGGKLKLEISEKPSALYDHSCYEFIFEDNGIGMSEEFLSHIFDPFERAEDTRTNKIRGTGLGMTIAQSLVQMMNGNIDVESKLNEGSRFTVAIHLKRQNTVIPDIKLFKGLSVLVVDHDDDSRKFSCSVLKDIGIKTEEIADGNDVMSYIQKAEDAKESFFAVIIDQNLQNIDGIQLAEKIKKEFGQKAPATIVSIQNWDDTKTDAHYEGVDGLISKPLFKTRLLYLLQNISEKENKKIPNQEEPSPEELFKGKRVLLVDDIDINLEIGTEIIGTTGITVETASNGKEALDKFEEMEVGYYNLIFMDIQMPVMNGYEATKAIRNSKKADAKQIPIVAMTANAFTEDMMASKRAGMNEHIAKPINVEQLLDCLTRWLVNPSTALHK